MRKKMVAAIFTLWLVIAIVAGVMGFGGMFLALGQSGILPAGNWSALTLVNWIGLAFAILGFMVQLMFVSLLAWLAVRLFSRNGAPPDKPGAETR